MGRTCSMNETILIGKSKGRSLGRITCIWDDNIKMGVQEIGWEVRIGVIWSCRVANGGLF